MVLHVILIWSSSPFKSWISKDGPTTNQDWLVGMMWQFGYCSLFFVIYPRHPSMVRECTSSQLASRQAKIISKDNLTKFQDWPARAPEITRMIPKLIWSTIWFCVITNLIIYLYMYIYIYIWIPGLPAITKGTYFQPASFSASSYDGTQPPRRRIDMVAPPFLLVLTSSYSLITLVT